MAEIERVTVSLSNDLVRDIDRQAKNRGKFVAEAVRHELDRRRRAELRRSLRNPHSETAKFADRGFEEWARNLPEEDAAVLVDPALGRPVRWIASKGWLPGDERR